MFDERGERWREKVMFFSYRVCIFSFAWVYRVRPDTLYNEKFVLEEKGKCDESQMKINSLWKLFFLLLLLSLFSVWRVVVVIHNKMRSTKIIFWRFQITLRRDITEHHLSVVALAFRTQATTVQKGKEVVCFTHNDRKSIKFRVVFHRKERKISGEKSCGYGLKLSTLSLNSIFVLLKFNMKNVILKMRLRESYLSIFVSHAFSIA